MANQANIKAVITAEDRSGAVMQGFTNKVSGFSKTAIGIAKKASVAFAAATVAATGFAVKSAADFEQTRIGLENMLGSADKARILLGKVSKFAAETPFEFPELAQATKQLVAFGFSAEDAFKTMTQLGDVSAAIGTPINDLAYLMGTLRTQGRAFTIDIRQFAQRGVPIYEYLAKVLKTNTKEITKMIEEGKIGFPEVQKAFQSMTGEGGKFHEAMAKQSKSLSGLFSTLKDNIGQTARELVGITQEGDVKEGSLFDLLRTGVAWLIANLPKLRATIANSLGFVMEMVRPSIESLWNTIQTELIPSLKELWKLVGPTLGPALKTIAIVMGGLIVGSIIALAYGLKGLIKVVSFTINTFVTFERNLIGSARRVSSAFGSAWQNIVKNWSSAKSFFSGVWNGITSIFRSGVNNVLGNINKIIRGYNAVAGKIPGGKKVSEIPAFASGVSNFRGGMALVGEQGPELVNLPRGSSVKTNTETNKMLNGQPVNITIQAGAFMGSQQEARKYAKMIMEAWGDLQSSGRVTA